MIPALQGGATPLPGLSVAVNPEFMREGSSLRDFDQPLLTLVGCESKATADMLHDVYAKVEAPFVHASVRSPRLPSTYQTPSMHSR